MRVENICTFLYLPNGLDRKRLGIVASRKVGNAVIRNRAKRRIRDVFRRHKHLGAPAMDIVIISARRLVHLPFSVLEKKLVQTLEKVK